MSNIAYAQWITKNTISKKKSVTNIFKSQAVCLMSTSMDDGDLLIHFLPKLSQKVGKVFIQG